MKPAKALANFALAVASPLFAFALAEGLLALFDVKPLALTEDPYVGFSSLQPLFTDSTGPDGVAYYVTHPAKLTHFNAQRFAKRKGHGPGQDDGKPTVRIFTLGGSTTYGHPFHDPTSYTGWLRAFLAKADTNKHYEVINAGGISYASYREAELMNELSRYEPDLFVVYSGHNEFLEERTYRRLTQLPPALRTLSAALDRTRTYSALRALVRRLTPGTLPGAKGEAKPTRLAGEVDDVLAKTIGPTSYVRDDSLKAQVLDHFRFSLDRMGRIAAAAGARILYVTTPVNEKDCAPFKSQPTPGLTGESAAHVTALAREADSLSGLGQADAAFARFDQAARLDPRNASLRYAAGQAALKAAQGEAAKHHLRAAIEEDVCPLRALAAMDTAMRQAAAAHGGVLVDFVDTLEAQSRTGGHFGLLGAPDFLDHVHLDLPGYRELGLLLYERIRQTGLLSPGAALTPEAVAAVTDSLNGLMTPRERSLALTNLAKVINWAGKHEEAAKLAEEALQLDTGHIETIWSSLLVGALRERQGRGLEALPHYRRAVRLDPGFAESHMYLGGALMRLDSLEAARRELEMARELAPQDPDVAAQWGKLEERLREQAASAMPAAPAAQAAAPATGQVATLLMQARISEQKGDLGGAIQAYARVLQLDPAQAEAKAGIARLLQGLPVNGP